MIEIKEKFSIREQVNDHMQAVNRHDLATFAASYRKDAVVYDPMYPEPLRGREAIRKDMEEFMTAFPDLQGSLGWIVETANMVAYEVLARGTHQGPLIGPGGTIAATNRTMIMPVVSFVRFDDEGLVAEERRYYDLAGVMRQLGSMPG
jgi:steroid delta-isomerase-like uncharacterized protein